MSRYGLPRTSIKWSKFSRGPPRWLQDWRTYPARRGWGNWSQPVRRSDGFWGDLTAACQCLTGGHQDNKARLYPVACTRKMRGNAETREAQTRYTEKNSCYEDREAVGQGEAECQERLCSLQPSRFPRPYWTA